MPRAAFFFTGAIVVFSLFSGAASALPSTYDGLLAQGHAAYAAGDFKGALDKYREAKAKDAGKPHALFFAGLAEARLGQIDAAMASFGAAAAIAGDKDIPMKGKALFAAAYVRESQGEWDAAYDAWKAYLDFAASKSGAALYPDTAKARMGAIEKRRALEVEGSKVRARAENKAN